MHATRSSPQCVGRSQERMRGSVWAARIASQCAGVRGGAQRGRTRELSRQERRGTAAGYVPRRKAQRWNSCSPLICGFGNTVRQ